MENAAKQLGADRPEQFSTRWEFVGRSSGWTAFGKLCISTWRLKVDGGWLYKVTEWDEDGHFVIQVCFAPEQGRQP
jgi:hypothetical protein